MAFNIAQVQKLYVAYFNRPADTNGLAFWQSQLSATVPATQAQLTTLASGFSGSPEYAALYAGQTNSQIINSLYLNLFGRSAETAGLNHWVGQLDAGTMTFAQIALQLTFSAQGTDATAINNKVTAATQFTNALDTPAKVAGYSGTAAAASARSFLASVTDNPTTLTTATANVAAAVASATAQGAVDPDGATIILTTDVDAYEGTGKGDLFVADVLTLTSDTVIDGLGGVDTLSATATGGDAIAATLTSVENVHIQALGDQEFNAENWAGVQQIRSVESVGNLTISALSSSNTIIAFQDTFSDIAVTYTSAALAGITTVNVVLDNVEGSGIDLSADATSTTNVVNNIRVTSVGDIANILDDIVLGGSADILRGITIDGSQDLEIETALDPIFNLANTNAMSGDLTLSADGDAAEDFIFNAGAMSGDLTFGITTADGFLFNGSAMTGDAAITVTSAVSAVIRTGSGDDSIDVGDQLGNVGQVNGGAGDDVLIAEVDAANMTPSVIGVETLELTFDTGSLNAVAVVGTQSIVVAAVTNGNVVITNLNSSVTNVSFEDDGGNVELGYRSNTLGDLTVSLDGQAGETESLTVSRVASLTVVGEDAAAAFATGDITLDDDFTTKLSLTNNTTQDMTVGNITGESLTTLSVTAATGDIVVGNVSTDSNLAVNIAVANAAAALTATIGDFVLTVEEDRTLTLTANAVGNGILELSALSAFNLTIGVTSATGAIDVGAITSISSEGGDSSAVAITVGSTSGTVTLGAIAADEEGGTVTLDVNHGAGILTMLAGTAVITASGAIDITSVGTTGNVVFDDITSTEGDVTVDVSNTTGAITLGAVEAVDGVVAITVNSTDGDVGVGDIAAADNISVTIVAADTLGAGVFLTIGDVVAGSEIVLDLDSEAAVGVGLITSEAAENSGRVIDITLAGSGDVDISALVVDNVEGNTTRVNASALEGGLDITLSEAQDLVILGSGDDTVDTAESFIGSLDHIQGFGVGDTLVAVMGGGTFTIQALDAGDEVINLGSVSALTSAAIQTRINAFDAVANEGDEVAFDDAYFFNVGARAFLFLNDGDADFEEDVDFVIEFTGLNLGFGGSLEFVFEA